ncbi:NADP-dependent oxidoreductase, partial [Streptomyces yokosukanensis]|uniref:NADP-dependent oxidoreductase n=1 Tax=Streptomyces yokosukanensis TaxID=67386 RepID=UPI00131A8F96
MKAYVLTRYGGPDAMEIREVPEPQAGPGEVLIRVRAAGLNPIDHKLREGGLRLVKRLPLPMVAGSELAGEVEAVGAGVTRFAVGDRVFARVDKGKLGAFAPHAVVEESLVAKMPAALGFTDAAGLPLAGLTALQALRDELGLKPGDRVFISGGAGGVGTLAIQLAVSMGAEVATTASRAAPTW